jgi:hypothetical protein
VVKAETSREKISQARPRERKDLVYDPLPNNRQDTIQNTAHEIDSQLMVWEIGLKAPQTVGFVMRCAVEWAEDPR